MQISLKVNFLLFSKGYGSNSTVPFHKIIHQYFTLKEFFYSFPIFEFELFINYLILINDRLFCFLSTHFVMPIRMNDKHIIFTVSVCESHV